ncbi:ribosomal protein s35 mitochondrial protein [Diplodia corticola]|uniref:Ribosomal protein s35 mitochondrial protein n=1 Tax=Diplodia corticola TaxID=236234 RepID=A0A1J9RV37_9PEZI|nr:ribosomal protein s35 mitochondrial protein [Diplodia corticola]OJD32271.1 ribosomal protein s35 mitochondrial protein [Diplodia corticola]
MPSRLPSGVASSLSHCVPAARSQCTPQASHQWHARSFSRSCRNEQTALRRQMYDWLNGPGAKLRYPLPGSTNYLGAYDKQGNLLREVPKAPPKKRERDDEEELGDGGLEAHIEAPKAEEAEAEQDDGKLPPESKQDLSPFPLNKHFHSQPVLSEELREKVYEDSVVDKKPLAVISTSYKITMERAAAVVRLKTMEKQWEAQGKSMAKPYSKAVLQMLPQTPLFSNPNFQPPHEPIADIPVHSATRQQLFYPTSESRHFTRADAAKAFAPDLLPADQRIPQPGLVEVERDQLVGLSFDERVERQKERNARNAEEQLRRKAKQAAKEARTQRVLGRRWDFKFQDFSVEQVGRDGRGGAGVGWRYGMPHEDRKRGQVKIPTRVDT